MVLEALSPPPFEARVLPLEDVVVVVLRGEADLTTVPAIDDCFATAARLTESVVADLTGLSFMDSSGLHALIRAHGRFAAQGRRFGLACAPPGPVHRLLELTLLEHVMPIHADRDTAMRALRG